MSKNKNRTGNILQCLAAVEPGYKGIAGGCQTPFSFFFSFISLFFQAIDYKYYFIVTALFF